MKPGLNFHHSIPSRLHFSPYISFSHPIEIYVPYLSHPFPLLPLSLRANLYVAKTVDVIGNLYDMSYIYLYIYIYTSAKSYKTSVLNLDLHSGVMTSIEADNQCLMEHSHLSRETLMFHSPVFSFHLPLLHIDLPRSSIHFSLTHWPVRDFNKILEK